jgi:hypothetical protein
MKDPNDMSEYSQALQLPATRGLPAGERAAPAAHPGALLAIIGRIEEAIDLETRSIRTDVNFDLKASNARKSRHLYELNRAIKGIALAQLGDGDRDGIIRLRGKLATNEAAIRAHLDAVGEIAALVRDAIEHHEADGTYSSAEFGRTAAR